MTAPDDLTTHLPILLAKAGIESVQIDVLSRRDSFQGGEVSVRAQEVTGPARDEHKRRSFGFWEFVLSATYDIDSETRRGLMDGALRHNSAQTIQVVLPTAEFTDALEARAFTSLPERTIVSLASHVETLTGGDWHLPLLDMGAPVGASGELACVDAIDAIGLKGQLYVSGRSYHFISNEPVSKAAFYSLLARAQLLSPIVDSRWIAHQIIDGRAGLRISTDTVRHTEPHRFVRAVGSDQ